MGCVGVLEGTSRLKMGWELGREEMYSDSEGLGVKI